MKTTTFTQPQLQRRGEILRRMKELHTAANDREFTAEESREWDSLLTRLLGDLGAVEQEIGRASCRERV